MSRFGGGGRIKGARRGSPSDFRRQSFLVISMNHGEPPSWWRMHSPSRLTTVMGRLNTASQRLLELFLGGHEVSHIANLHGVSKEAMACSLTSLMAQVRHLVSLMPADSLENN